MPWSNFGGLPRASRQRKPALLFTPLYLEVGVLHGMRDGAIWSWSPDKGRKTSLKLCRRQGSPHKAHFGDEQRTSERPPGIAFERDWLQTPPRILERSRPILVSAFRTAESELSKLRFFIQVFPSVGFWRIKVRITLSSIFIRPFRVPRGLSLHCDLSRLLGKRGV